MAWVRTGQGDDGYEWYAPDVPDLSLEVTDNPVVAELLGPDGAVVRQWRARPPFGFRKAG
jgi:hypothetical protein